MVMSRMQAQDKAQQIYQRYIIKLAQEAALKNKQNLAFDPQGRILIDVTLTLADWQKVANEILDALEITKPERPLSLDSAKRIVSFYQGIRELQLTTTVSLDTAPNPDLARAFHTVLKQSLLLEDEQLTEEDLNTINGNLFYQQGTIIALQQELHFHLSLVLRVYQKILSHNELGLTFYPLEQTQLREEIHQEVMQELNQSIMGKFAAAIVNARNKKTGYIDFGVLNQILDQNRKSITYEAHTLLTEHILKKTGIKPSTANFKEALRIAKETPATENDLLHTDTNVGLATWIASSPHTSHNRVKGEGFAHRQIITHPISKTGEIGVNKYPRLQIRTPTPVVKKDRSGEYVQDVAIKLQAIKEHYDLISKLERKRIGNGLGKVLPRAYVYNSYTAFNDRGDDAWSVFSGNYQTRSAKHILQGIHEYNQQQFAETPSADSLVAEPPVLCFVQNISVNGFGDSLGYNSGNLLKEETTLMADIALIHTLFDTLREPEKEAVFDIVIQYKKYLETSPRLEYFSLSLEGKQAKERIQDLKIKWRKETTPVAQVADVAQNANPIDPNFAQYANYIDNNMNPAFLPRAQAIVPDMKTNVKLALKKLIANNLHFDHRYSKLVQSLSVFAEDVSLGGCKSGNERSQEVNGRVAILDGAFAKPENPISRLLFALVESADSAQVLRNTKLFNHVIDCEFNRIGLNTGCSEISLVDQGGPAKVEAYTGPVKKEEIIVSEQSQEVVEIVTSGQHRFYKDRNQAEEPCSIMTNLHQTQAATMQAHKNLTQFMHEASKGKSTWSSLKEQHSGPVIVGSIILGVIPFLLLFINQALINRKTQAANLNASNNIPSEPKIERDIVSSDTRMITELTRNNLSRANHSTVQLPDDNDEISADPIPQDKKYSALSPLTAAEDDEEIQNGLRN